MNRIFFIAVCFFVLAVPVFSHYHWIEPVDFDPEMNEALVFHICSGHQFQKSELLLRKDLIFSVGVLKGDKTVPVEISEEGRTWKGRIEPNGRGNVMLEFRLKKRTGKEPFYYGRSILKPLTLSDGEKMMMTGTDLEIVPELIRENGETRAVRFRVFSAGKQVRSDLVLIREGKKPVYLKPGKDDTAVFHVKFPGRYLAAAHYGGSGASLTFFINE